MGEDFGLADHVFAAFARQAEDEVASAGDSPLGGGGEGLRGAGKVVPSVDEPEGLVVAAFDAVFHHHVGALRQLLQVVQLWVIHAVGPCADYQAFDHWVAEGFFVALLQGLEFGVGVAIGLEVGQIAAFHPPSFLVEGDAFVNLLGDAFAGVAVGGVEGCVVAEGAARGAELSVAVGAGEAGVDGQLLHASAKAVSAVVGVGEALHSLCGGFVWLLPYFYYE